MQTVMVASLPLADPLRKTLRIEFVGKTGTGMQLTDDLILPYLLYSRP